MSQSLEYKAIQFKAEEINDKEMTIEGYISTWDEDLVGDIIHPGAFNKSINEAFPAGKIKALWQHELPMGMPVAMSSDSIGVFAKTKLSDTSENRDRLEYMKDGVVDSQSIGFTINKGRSEISPDGKRHIYEVNLKEYSAVTFPANPEAVITGVKSLAEIMMIAKSKGTHVGTKEEFEELVRKFRALMQTQAQDDSTPDEHSQPLVTEGLSILKELGDFAQNRLY